MHLFMKKKHLFPMLLGSMLLLVNSVSSRAVAEGEWYHYGFFLSCGRVEYRSYPVEKSDGELVKIHEDLEKQYCGGNAGEESGFQ